MVAILLTTISNRLHQIKIIAFWFKFLKIKLIIRSDDGLVLNRRQAITWTNDEQAIWCHVVSLSNNVIIFDPVSHFETNPALNLDLPRMHRRWYSNTFLKINFQIYVDPVLGEFYVFSSFPHLILLFTTRGAAVSVSNLTRNMVVKHTHNPPPPPPQLWLLNMKTGFLEDFCSWPPENK